MQATPIRVRNPRNVAFPTAVEQYHVRQDIVITKYPGANVDHEIFVNECDGFGRDTWPEACIDAPGVDRSKLHEYIGSVALKFFDTNLGVQR